MAIPDRSNFADGKFANIEDEDITSGSSSSTISANAKFVNIDDEDITNGSSSSSTISAHGKFVNIEDNDTTTSKTNVATDGGIVIDGDVSGSAVNSGVVQGAQAGDDVNAQGVVVGDDNIQADDVDAGAFALGGDATNAEVDADDVDGPLNLGLGEDITQLAEEDNSIDQSLDFGDSFNTDNSDTVEGLVDIEGGLADVDLDA